MEAAAAPVATTKRPVDAGPASKAVIRRACAVASPATVVGRGDAATVVVLVGTATGATIDDVALPAKSRTKTDVDAGTVVALGRPCRKAKANPLLEAPAPNQGEVAVVGPRPALATALDGAPDVPTIPSAALLVDAGLDGAVRHLGTRPSTTVLARHGHATTDVEVAPPTFPAQAVAPAPMAIDAAVRLTTPDVLATVRRPTVQGEALPTIVGRTLGVA